MVGSMPHSRVWWFSALLSILTTAACGGDCVSVGVSRLSPTERQLRVGESFVAKYEEGGVCGDDFLAVTDRVTWTTVASDIVQVDRLSGRVTALRPGDAEVVPSVAATRGPQGILVHVRE